MQIQTSQKDQLFPAGMHVWRRHFESSTETQALAFYPGKVQLPDF